MSCNWLKMKLTHCSTSCKSPNVYSAFVFMHIVSLRSHASIVLFCSTDQKGIPVVILYLWCLWWCQLAETVTRWDDESFAAHESFFSVCESYLSRHSFSVLLNWLEIMTFLKLCYWLTTNTWVPVLPVKLPRFLFGSGRISYGVWWGIMSQVFRRKQTK